MNPQFPQKRLAPLEDKDDQESFKNYQENNKLSLRKKRIFNALLSKRQATYTETTSLNNKYRIEIKNISIDEEIKTNSELYIKTKFDIKFWFKYLFSDNLNQIKAALYMIELFIRMQIKEIDIQKRVLSRNDTELINRLCDYLNHQDLQIVYYSLVSLINLTLFPKHIEARIKTERNINKILQFFNKYDFNLGYEILLLLINCTTENNQKIFFLENGVFERLNSVMNLSLDKLEFKYYIYIIRLLYNLSQIPEDYKCTVEKKLNWFWPFLPFVKKAITFCFVQNPWEKADDCKYYLGVLKFYVDNAFTNKKLLLSIINDEFSRILIEFYYKIKDDDNKGSLLKLFVDLLSNDDSINEYFIQDGILGLFLNEINEIGYKKKDLLDTILFACSNIACGAIGQIHQLYMQGLVWKCFEIFHYLSQQILTVENKKIMFNAIYVLTEVIIGCDSKIKVEIMMYQDFEIINIFAFTIKYLLDNNNEEFITDELGNSLYALIERGESDLEENSLETFKNKMIANEMEEIIQNIIFNHTKSENVEKKWIFIQEFLKE